jgi:DHA1 family bicyclomycin/chloramphenicol resistance-like MFS transporter
MTAGSVVLLAITLSDLRSPALLAGLLIVVALAFGLSVPNVMNATMPAGDRRRG